MTEIGMDEASLVLAAKSGDLGAFDQLVRAYRSAAVTLARQFLPREVAEDAAQDALISAYQALKNLDDPSRFKAWLGAIVRNRACRLARERGRSDTLPMYELDQAVLKGAPSLTVWTSLPCDEVRKAVEILPEGIRETIGLYYYESWSVSEIAVFTARPITTVKWQLHAGRQILKRRLSHLEDTNDD